MSENTRILSLPLIQGGQAQKHITHNEALRRLDALVQPVALDMDQTVPPGQPNEGDRHIVAAGATDAWLGQDGMLAVREGDAWTFITPGRGWQVYVIASGEMVIFDGVEWQGGGAATLGINATADSTNRLAVSADATLLTHEGAGHQVKVNKATPADTASLLFQTGFSGRAEMGCAGTDGFAVKVSADGATWNTAIRIDPATGKVAFPSGARRSRGVAIDGRWSCFTNNRWVTFDPDKGSSGDTHDFSAGTGEEPEISWRASGIFVSAGTRVVGIRGLIRATMATVTGFDIRIMFQTGPSTGGWKTNADTVRTVLHAQDNISTDGGWTSLDTDFADFEVPQNGIVTIYLRPRGTMTATRYLVSQLTLDLLI